MDYSRLWWILDYHGWMGIIIGYGLSWTIVDYCGTVWIIMDYCGFLNMHHHEIAWIRRYAPQASEDTKRYGAGMAHTIAYIGFMDYYRLSCPVWRIIMDDGRWWTIMDCHGLWTIIGYYGLSWILDYHGIIMDSGVSWYYRRFWTTMVHHGLLWIMDYHGLLVFWIIVYYCGLSDFLGVSWMMDYRGLS